MLTHDVEFPGVGVRLSGTITLPDAAAPVPGVVLVNGSGPVDRHGNGFFDVLRDHLAGAGVAVLTYDKRGTGQSTGTWPTATVDHLAGDAGAAVAVLHAHERVAAGAVGVLGHSEGGWVALRLCAGAGGPAHLILNSCPAVSFAEAEMSSMTKAGVDRDLTEALFAQLLAAVRAGYDFGKGQLVLAEAVDERLRAVLTADDFSMNETTWSVLRAWGDYDPGGDLGRLQTPALAVLGGQDPLVPVEASLVAYQDSARRAGRPQRTVAFAGAGHRLETGAGLAPGYLDLLSTWCLEPLTRR